MGWGGIGEGYEMGAKLGEKEKEGDISSIFLYLLDEFLRKPPT